MAGVPVAARRAKHQARSPGWVDSHAGPDYMGILP